jgi:hypothetical protein
MAQEGREGPMGDSYNGETYRRSADASQYHPSENEQVQRQPQSAVSIHGGPMFALPYYHDSCEGPTPFKLTILGLRSLECPTVASRLSGAAL